MVNKDYQNVETAYLRKLSDDTSVPGIPILLAL